MIEPIVCETEWLERLEPLPTWHPPAMPTVVVAPHPDDETLGAGGLIAAYRGQGVDVLVVAVTDGERAYADSCGLADRRRAEQRKALSRLGVENQSICRLGLPDSDVAANEQELVERLSGLVSENTHVVAPWKGDFHPDHQACGRAAERAVRDTGALLTSYFFWTWHFGTVALLQDLRLVRFRLSPNLLLDKTEALRCHQSQLVCDTEEPILPESLLLPARRPFEIFLTR